MGGRDGGSGEQCLKGLKGRAIQPQAAYVCQPGSRVFHGYVQDDAGCLLVIDSGVSHGLDGHEDDVCSLRRMEVFSKCLQEEGREGRHVTVSALRLLLS